MRCWLGLSHSRGQGDLAAPHSRERKWFGDQMLLHRRAQRNELYILLKSVQRCRACAPGGLSSAALQQVATPLRRPVAWQQRGGA
jgi:hypothetical protein